MVCVTASTVASDGSGTYGFLDGTGTVAWSDCSAGGVVAGTMAGANSYADCVVVGATGTVAGVPTSVLLEPAPAQIIADVLAGNVAGGVRADDLTGLADGFVGANPSPCAGAKGCAEEGMTCTDADADIALDAAVINTATDTDLASCRSPGPACAGVYDNVGSTCFHFGLLSETFFLPTEPPQFLVKRQLIVLLR